MRSSTSSRRPPVIVWFRQDLRLSDNPALCAAIGTGSPLLLVYVLDDEAPGRWRAGGASRWWLHHSLAALGADIAARNARLVLRRGAAAKVIAALIEETGAEAVFWNRAYEPFATARDTRIKAALLERGVAAHSFNAALLCEPWTMKTKSGEPYKVFTPFWRAVSQIDWPREASAPPRRFVGCSAEIASDDLDAWGLAPGSPDWAAGLRATWRPGEAAARARLDQFLDQALALYARHRDRPDRNATSRLSPHLHWGEISPAQIWRTIEAKLGAAPELRSQAEKFLSELGWREFAHHLLYHWPDLPDRNWRARFDAFGWRDDDAGFAAWRAGQTGYPIVDAGMRELWATGWIHNRVRMLTASFLVKHLLIDWRCGALWFWDTLVDADLANNAASWQWAAGSGADAAPYFRIFNPTTQGERFDPEGAYVRRWVPELANLPDQWLHRPWDAPPDILTRAGVELGRDYPEPIVGHAFARERALAAYAALKTAA